MSATRDDVQRLVQRVVLYAWVGNKEEVLYRVKREMTDVPATKFDGALSRTTRQEMTVTFDRCWRRFADHMS